MRKMFPLFLIAGIFLLVAPAAAHADWLFFGTHFRVGHVGVSLGYGPPVPFYPHYYAPVYPYYGVAYRPLYRPAYRVPYYRPYAHFYGRPIHRGRYFAPHIRRRY